MAGALLGAQCYASQDAAADAYYSGAAPGQTPGGSASYLSVFVKDAGVWKLRRYSVSGSGEVSTYTDAVLPAMVFPSCDPLENFKDGMTVGWGVVAAMVLAWGVGVLRRGV